ncbi:C6 transcription factor [Lasiodiplodia theobromae]|uniref:C6 transcription factor n=1 Tax=Lasiodiplodia theobromae TaxID=45133 RepID=UPI0015C3D782|nr:C6 transcription factor [Lasiodiplodia theobromae]KAF4537407.1 C6 transcription factor [Lasiodiplodia theobromae]
MAEARRLLNEVVFKTGENESSIFAFPDDVQANFANAISNLIDNYRADPVAYNLRPNRMKCLSCTAGTRSCEAGDGDFTCTWCESNASLCITRTEGTLFVAPRVQEKTMDPKSERYWLSEPRLKRRRRRRTGLELLA